MGDTRHTGLGTLSLRDDGILHVVFDTEQVPTPELSAEYLAARTELVGLSPPPIVLEIIRIPFAARGIRQAFLDELTAPPCRAVVVNDRTADTVYRSFELLGPPSVPTNVFHRMEDAIAWIHKTMESD